MAFTRLKIDNLFCFKNTELNLSFSRPPVNSSLEGEFIDGYEKFYFKKVCILSGANASGKTSLGRVLFSIQRFLDKGNLHTSMLKITDVTQPAYIEVDFFQKHTHSLYRVALSLQDENNNGVSVQKSTLALVKLRKNDSCNSATKRLDKVWQDGKLVNNNNSRYYSSDLVSTKDFSELFKSESITFAWHYILSENEEVGNKISQVDKNVLTAVLKTFDKTIKSVLTLTSKDSEKENEPQGYSIVFNNNDKVFIDPDGEITNKERLSRGTYEAIKISQLLSGIIEDKNDQLHYSDNCSCIYFLDEKMAYTHTELEKIIITLIISKLSRYSQFFYTTHNYDVLSLDLPAHSFSFTKKEESVTSFIDAIDVYKKNDRNLLTFVKNDCFGTIPDVSLIENMLFED